MRPLAVTRTLREVLYRQQILLLLKCMKFPKAVFSRSF